MGRNRFWNGCCKEEVERYKKSLEEEIEEIRKTPYFADRLFVVEKVKANILELLDDELDLCNFWLEYKTKSEANTWKEETRESYPLKDTKGLSRANGRLKFFLWTEELKMARACLMVENDSEYLEFLPNHHSIIKTTSYVNKNKIQEKVEEVMEYSYTYEKSRLFPRGNTLRNSYDEMCDLLFIERH